VIMDRKLSGNSLLGWEKVITRICKYE
jgi:hypothetical protein